MTAYCPQCHLVLAPKDPFAKPFNGVRFHGDCLPKYKLRIDAQFRAGRPLKVRKQWSEGPGAHGARESL